MSPCLGGLSYLVNISCVQKDTHLAFFIYLTPVSPLLQGVFPFGFSIQDKMAIFYYKLGRKG